MQRKFKVGDFVRLTVIDYWLTPKRYGEDKRNSYRGVLCKILGFPGDDALTVVVNIPYDMRHIPKEYDEAYYWKVGTNDLKLVDRQLSFVF